MSRLLFNEKTFTEFGAEVFQTLASIVNNLVLSEYKKKSIEELSHEIFEKIQLKPLELNLDKVYQKPPKDSTITRQSQFERGYREMAGTTFTFVLPYTGNQRLFEVQPSRWSTNVPYGEVTRDELRFEYQVAQTGDKQVVKEEYQKNLSNIQNWIINLNNDIEHFNEALKKEINGSLSNRKRKLDNDQSAADSFGIPIR